MIKKKRIKKKASRTKIDPIDKAKQFPKSRRYAIRAKCFDCVGRGADKNWTKAVRECPSKDTCPLYLVRPYQPKITTKQKTGGKKKTIKKK